MSKTRCGYVAIIGAPNAGKSTVLNRMIGSKVAIVTPKVQTTRNRILGMVVHQKTQCIFIDTPGIFAAKKKFEQAMVSSAFSGAGDADIIMLMVDAYKGMSDEVRLILERLKSYEATKILVLNKVDKSGKAVLPMLAKEIFDEDDFDRCFMISAAKGDGVDDVMDYLAETLPEGTYLYPEDQMTDIPMRQIAAEITRETLFYRLKQEVPYSVSVDTESWEDTPKGVKIKQVIHVQTESQKKIIIGKQGCMLKQIGERARKEIGKLVDQDVHLFLFVKVSENWKDNPDFYTSIGLEYKKN